MERVTLTLPGNLIKEIDRHENNRSKFVVEAVRRELERRRREDLRLSLQKPHPESVGFSDRGLSEWALGLPQEDVTGLVTQNSGIAVRWVAGKGWIKEDG